MTSSKSVSDQIIHLNVGGTRFSTSLQTLSQVPDTFFTCLISGRIHSLRDDQGAIFIDRDPCLFRVILNYLRNRTISFESVKSHETILELLHEAEYYGIGPLIKELSLCVGIQRPGCGGVLFQGYLAPPASLGSFPIDFTRCNRNSRLRPVVSNSYQRHSRNSSADFLGYDGLMFGYPSPTDTTFHVHLITAHHNTIAVAYSNFVALFRQRETNGFHLMSNSPHCEFTIERIALNARMIGSLPDQASTMLALSLSDSSIRLFAFNFQNDVEDTSCRRHEIVDDGIYFNLHASLDRLFFIGTQLVAISKCGRIGVWKSVTQSWQSQELGPITSHDTAGSFLLLGAPGGSINYIDMQKFPLRIKDNDLLVTELYRDPDEEVITAISVFLTPKTVVSGNWIEIAYGTASGIVRVIVQHPETLGHGPQLFQTFLVHRSAIRKVKLSEKFLVSICSEYNHVRTWGITRFRGMISTQPGSTAVASFKILSLDTAERQLNSHAGNDFGPYGEQDEEQLFVQKVVPDTDTLFVLMANNGRRICKILSIDGTAITSFCVHEFAQGSSRIGSRPRRFVFTGHSNGAIQLWDLTTALETSELCDEAKFDETACGPNPQEIVRLLGHCDLSNSRPATPCVSPAISLRSHTIKPVNQAFINVAARSEMLFENKP